MIYILIIYLHMSNHAASFVVEFNDLSSCQAAANEFRKQYPIKSDVIMCAAKGKK